MNPSATLPLPATPSVKYPFPSHLAYRIAFLIALFAAELIVISIRLDTGALNGRAGFIGAIGTFGPAILQAVVVFAAVFLAFGFATAKAVLTRVSDELAGVPFQRAFLAAHACSMAVFAFLSPLVFGASRNGLENLAAIGWLSAGVLGIATGIFFFFPPKIVRGLLRDTGAAWIYAAGAAAVTPLLVTGSERLWKPATATTFALVQLLLRPFVSAVVSDPASWTLGTKAFSVQIAPACSGLEGMGLMLMFGVIWLGYFRKNYKFPAALLLIPAGMGLMFLLNAVRITGLILIGNAGAPGVALGGFHSQAGWLAFNAVALGLASVAHRIPGVSVEAGDVAREQRTPEESAAADNPPAAYLVPFLAILAAGMISRAASGTFEWMYPLRFIAAGAALWMYRKRYSRLDWSFGWAAPLTGGVVFLLWIGLDRFAGIPRESGIAAGVAALSQPARIAWLTFRTLAAVVTVPIAEELAFRGFLLRRLIAADFESVSFQRWTWLAVAGSSVAFGFMHGDRWIAGTAAGLLYAGVQKWRGRIGDAMVAHSVTNALIAVWVLWGGNWSLW